jgi:hypothetical protein
MWLDLSIIVGTCAAGIVFGLVVYWIITKVQKQPQANQSGSITNEVTSPPTDIKDIAGPSTGYSVYKAKKAPDFQAKSDTETADDDWLNKGVLEASSVTLQKEDDDWLNSGVEEVPTNVLKQQDEAWLNAENERSPEALDESSVDPSITDSPEIQFKQDGDMLNITVTTSKKPASRPEQTVINLRINVPPQDSATKSEQPCEVQVITDDSLQSSQSLEDAVTIKSLEEPDDQSYSLMDEISVRRLDGSG